MKKILVLVSLMVFLTACSSKQSDNTASNKNTSKYDTETLYEADEIFISKTCYPENKQTDQYAMNSYQINMNGDKILEYNQVELIENDSMQVIITKDDQVIYDKEAKLFYDDSENIVYDFFLNNLSLRADLEEGLKEKYVIKVTYKDKQMKWEF